MISALAALLLSAWAAEPGTAQDAAPPAQPPASGPAATVPPADASAAPPEAQPSPPLNPRMEAYEQFRTLYETGRYTEALPFAVRIVELTEPGPQSDYELPIAYNNLGATQFQIGDFDAAAKSYRQSLELIEASQGISSRRLIVPLSQLGAVNAALDQHDAAVRLFERAIAVSRRSEGLFNLAQLPLLEGSAESRFTIGDFTGVRQDRLYALKIAEQNYGYNDDRTLPAVIKLAAFYESLHEFGSARAMYLRARDISITEAGGYNPLTIRSLLGIARMQRLEIMTDSNPLDPAPTRDQVTGEYLPPMTRATYVISPNLDRAGLKSAQSALEILRAATDPPRDLLADTLIELGDWYQSTSRPGHAAQYYSEAAILQASNPDIAAANPLSAPRLVVYRPPIQSTRSLERSGEDFVIHKTVFGLGVSESGEPIDIRVIESDMSEGQLSQCRRAIARAIYSPRFVDGKPVATADVTFISEWHAQRMPEASPATPAEPAGSESPTPEQAPPPSAGGS